MRWRKSLHSHDTKAVLRKKGEKNESNTRITIRINAIIKCFEQFWFFVCVLQSPSLTCPHTVRIRYGCCFFFFFALLLLIWFVFYSLDLLVLFVFISHFICFSSDSDSHVILHAIHIYLVYASETPKRTTYTIGSVHAVRAFVCISLNISLGIEHARASAHVLPNKRDLTVFVSKMVRVCAGTCTFLTILQRQSNERMNERMMMMVSVQPKSYLI